MGRRIRWFGLAMIICFCGLLVQLDNIQGLKANAYQHAANNPVTLENEYYKPRGRIVTSDGVTVANSVLAPPNAYYKYQRVYPTGSLFSQIVGFTSYNYGTYTGVEAQYNSYLTYHTQSARTLSGLFDTEQGTDTVNLTLSDKFQKVAQQALGSDDGAVVMLNPSNGDILAMYSNPTFDPTQLVSPSRAAEEAGWATYIAKDAKGFTNGTPLAFDQGFQPGSTFKVITTAAAFDHDLSLTTRSFPNRFSYIPPGAGNVALHNDNNISCGGTIQVMLPQSCDTGYAMMGVDLGAQNLADEAAAFGFGPHPPIDLPTGPGSVSIFPAALGLEEGNTPYVAYSAIGQYDVQATPLEMAMVAGAIADDGVIMKPHVLDSISDPNDNVVDSYKPTEWLRATSPNTAQAITSLMESVVTTGTAKNLFPAAWDVAAKTGTAQAGLNNTVTNDWMIAFAPANHPQIAVAVMVPNQVSSTTGAGVAGPIMRSVLNGYFEGGS